MSLSHEYTDNFFIGERSILDAHLRLLFRANHYETPCTSCIEMFYGTYILIFSGLYFLFDRKFMRRSKLLYLGSCRIKPSKLPYNVFCLPKTIYCGDLAIVERIYVLSFLFLLIF
jgi:hypothetical protein